MKWNLDELFCKKKKEVSTPTWCVPSSIFCALTFAIKYNVPVRIAIFKLDKGTDHAQAQAYVGEEWRYLTEYWNGTSMAAKTYGKNLPATEKLEPYKYYGLIEFLAQQSEALHLDF
jgi:hypothetical protein